MSSCWVPNHPSCSKQEIQFHSESEGLPPSKLFLSDWQEFPCLDSLSKFPFSFDPFWLRTAPRTESWVTCLARTCPSKTKPAGQSARVPLNRGVDHPFLSPSRPNSCFSFILLEQLTRGFQEDSNCLLVRSGVSLPWLPSFQFIPRQFRFIVISWHLRYTSTALPCKVEAKEGHSVDTRF